MSLSDARRLYVALRDSGTEGVHSHDIRRMGLSGNPSSRCKDIVSHGVAVSTRREAVGRRPGSRYWLAEHAPSDATPMLPNRATRTCENCGGSLEGLRADAKFCTDTCRAEARDARRAVESRGNEVLSIAPSPADTHEPVAIVRDGDSFTEVPVDARPCRRCEGTGHLPDVTGLVGLACPACFGTGVIARTRVNSYVQAEAA